MLKSINISILILIILVIYYLYSLNKSNFNNYNNSHSESNNSYSESNNSHSDSNNYYSNSNNSHSESNYSDSNDSHSYSTSIIDHFQTSNINDINFTKGLYARYQAKDYNSVTNTWLDSSPNKNNLSGSQINNKDIIITNSDGQNGASKIFPIIRGTPNTQISFTQSELDVYTLIYICRYCGPKKDRIIVGKNSNWISGFWNGKSGIAYHEGWVTNSKINVHNNNWFIAIDSGNLYRTNATSRTIMDSLKISLPPFGINIDGGSSPSDRSDFEIADIMIFNKELTTNEYTVIEKYLSQSYGIFDINFIDGVYARYQAKDYNSTTNVWYDSSPNKSNLSGSNITQTDLLYTNSDGKNGANAIFPIIRGTTNTEIIFTNNSITDYTIFHICRYIDGPNRKRIIHGQTTNWLSGFWDGKSGVAYCTDSTDSNNSRYITRTDTDIHKNNWVISIHSNYFYRSNGITRGIHSTKNILPIIGIGGKTFTNERSDFEIADLIIFNKQLSTDEYTTIEKYLSQIYGISINIPMNISNDLFNINLINGVYARYEAKNYDPTTNTWFDSSPNKYNLLSSEITNKNILIVPNNKQFNANENFIAINGTPNTKIIFTKSKLESYTLIHICRYIDGPNRKRIINGNEKNISWLSGSWDGKTGLAYHNNWLTVNSFDMHQNNWFISIDSKNFYRSNGLTRNISNSTSTSNTEIFYLPPFGINCDNGLGANEKSDFEIADVIIFNRELSFFEYTIIEKYLSQIYGISINLSDYNSYSKISDNLLIENLYARYQAKDYNPVTNIWLDSSPNKYDLSGVQIINTNILATKNNGQNDASGNFPIIRGTTNTKIYFTNTILSKYTLIHVCRYVGTNRQRIIRGNIGNWISGFWSGKSGVAYHQGWITDFNKDYHENNWFISVDSGTFYRSNGITKGTTGGAITYLPPICINGDGGDYVTERSDFEIAELMIFNRELTSLEYTAIEKYLSQSYGIFDPNFIDGIYRRFQAVNYYYEKNIWLDSSPIKIDLSGSNITQTGLTYTNSDGKNGASKIFPIIKGTTETIIKFGNTTISDFTLIHVCRYAGDNKKNIIISSNSFSSGFKNGNSGVAYRSSKWITDKKDNHQSSWVISVESNNFYRSNGIDRTTNNINVKLPPNLSINDYIKTNKSEFEIAELIIFNRKLTVDEYTQIEKYLSKIYGIPIN